MANASVQQMIIAEAQRQGVDPGIALAVATRESGQNPNISDGVAGEIGIFQVLPSTAPGANLRDLTSNIQFGISYLKQMYSEFGNWPLAVAAYNDGPGNVQQYLACTKALPASTLAYVMFVTSVGLVQSCAVAANPASSPANTITQSTAPTLNPDGSVWDGSTDSSTDDTTATADNNNTVLLLGAAGIAAAWWLFGD